jgi:hypothetical protein
VLRGAEKTETTLENIQEWLELDERDPGFVSDRGKIAALIFFYLFSSPLRTLLNFPFIQLLSFFSCTAIFCFINPGSSVNPDDLPIKFIRIRDGLL